MVVFHPDLLQVAVPMFPVTEFQYIGLETLGLLTVAPSALLTGLFWQQDHQQFQSMANPWAVSVTLSPADPVLPQVPQTFLQEAK